MVREEISAIQTIEPIPPALLREPLEFLFAEHYRHRQMCRALEQLAALSEFAGVSMRSVERFLSHDLVLHVKDEEEDFFPLLRQRCEPEDDIDAVLDQLSEEHRADERYARAAQVALSVSLANGVAISQTRGGADALLRLAAQERRHLALENAVVMPIARIRLAERDLQHLSSRFAARHGVELT
jgi:hemerythrin-like domain-containing protein